MIGMAFQVTEDDVYYALTTNGVRVTEEQCGEMYELLEHDAIEKAALYGNNMDEQTGYAHQEIWRQLRHHYSVAA